MLTVPVHAGRCSFILMLIKVKKLLLFFVIVTKPIFGFASGGLADTIDYWHVSYNDKVIGKFNVTSSDLSIIIKKVGIKPSDILSVSYGNDSPCGSCITTLYVKIRSQRIILTKNKGTFTALKVDIAKLSDIIRSSNNSAIDVFYTDEHHDRKLLKVKLE
jgi:hypothetical protein